MYDSNQIYWSSWHAFVDDNKHEQRNSFNETNSETYSPTFQCTSTIPLHSVACLLWSGFVSKMNWTSTSSLRVLKVCKWSRGTIDSSMPQRANATSLMKRSEWASNNWMFRIICSLCGAADRWYSLLIYYCEMTLLLMPLIAPVIQQRFIYFTTPGGRLNKKDGLTRYGNSHVKDKTS